MDSSCGPDWHASPGSAIIVKVVKVESPHRILAVKCAVFDPAGVGVRLQADLLAESKRELTPVKTVKNNLVCGYRVSGGGVYRARVLRYSSQYRGVDERGVLIRLLDEATDKCVNVRQLYTISPHLCDLRQYPSQSLRVRLSGLCPVSLTLDINSAGNFCSTLRSVGVWSEQARASLVQHLPVGTLCRLHTQRIDSAGTHHATLTLALKPHSLDLGQQLIELQLASRRLDTGDSESDEEEKEHAITALSDPDCSITNQKSEPVPDSVADSIVSSVSHETTIEPLDVNLLKRYMQQKQRCQSELDQMANDTEVDKAVTASSSRFQRFSSAIKRRREQQQEKCENVLGRPRPNDESPTSALDASPTGTRAPNVGRGCGHPRGTPIDSPVSSYVGSVRPTLSDMLREVRRDRVDSQPNTTTPGGRAVFVTAGGAHHQLQVNESMRSMVFDQRRARSWLQRQPIKSRSTADQPITARSTADQLITARSAADQPIIVRSTADKPITARSTADRPVTARSTADQPITARSTADQPITARSTADQPFTLRSTADQPITPRSIADQPITPRSTADQQTTSQWSCDLPVEASDLDSAGATVTPIESHYYGSPRLDSSPDAGRIFSPADYTSTGATSNSTQTPTARPATEGRDLATSLSNKRSPVISLLLSRSGTMSDREQCVNANSTSVPPLSPAFQSEALENGDCSRNYHPHAGSDIRPHLTESCKIGEFSYSKTSHASAPPTISPDSQRVQTSYSGVQSDGIAEGNRQSVPPSSSRNWSDGGAEGSRQSIPPLRFSISPDSCIVQTSSSQGQHDGVAEGNRQSVPPLRFAISPESCIAQTYSSQGQDDVGAEDDRQSVPPLRFAISPDSCIAQTSSSQGQHDGSAESNRQSIPPLRFAISPVSCIVQTSSSRGQHDGGAEGNRQSIPPSSSRNQSDGGVEGNRQSIPPLRFSIGPDSCIAQTSSSHGQYEGGAEGNRQSLPSSSSRKRSDGVVEGNRQSIPPLRFAISPDPCIVQTSSSQGQLDGGVEGNRQSIPPSSSINQSDGSAEGNRQSIPPLRFAISPDSCIVQTSSLRGQHDGSAEGSRQCVAALSRPELDSDDDWSNEDVSEDVLPLIDITRSRDQPDTPTRSDDALHHVQSVNLVNLPTEINDPVHSDTVKLVTVLNDPVQPNSGDLVTDVNDPVQSISVDPITELNDPVQSSNPVNPVTELDDPVQSSNSVDLITELNDPVQSSNSVSLITEFNDPVQSSNSVNLITELNDPVQSSNSVNLITELNDPVQSVNSLNLITELNDPVQSSNSVNPITELNDPVQSSNSVNLITELNDPVQSSNSVNLITELNDPVRSSNSVDLITELNDPVQSVNSVNLITELNDPLQSSNSVNLVTELNDPVQSSNSVKLITEVNDPVQSVNSVNLITEVNDPVQSSNSVNLIPEVNDPVQSFDLAITTSYINGSLKGDTAKVGRNGATDASRDELIADEYDRASEDNEFSDPQRLHRQSLHRSAVRVARPVRSGHAGVSHDHCPLRVLVRSNRSIQAWSRQEHVQFSRKANQVLSTLNLHPSRAQSYLWPSVYLLRNTVCVGADRTGKTLGYLVPLLDRWNDTQLYHQLPTGAGPVFVVVCGSWRRVMEVQAQCQSVAKSVCEPVCRVLAAHGPCNDQQTQTGLLNGCEVLVATLPALLRLVAGNILPLLQRCCHLVLDDANILIEQHLKSLDELLTRVQREWRERQSNAALLPAQCVVLSKHWSKQLGELTSHLHQPAVIVSSYVEQMVFSAPPINTYLLEDVDKFQRVHDLLTGELCGLRVVIFSSCEQQLSRLSQYLSQHHTSHILINSSHTFSQQTEREGVWQSDSSAVLLVSDTVCRELSSAWLADATVHCDLPSASRTQLGLRCSFAVPSVAPVHLLISDQQLAQLAAPLEKLLRRCGACVPEQLRTAAASCCEASEQSLCRQLVLFGRCVEGAACRFRHRADSSDVSASHLPSHGELCVSVTHVRSAGDLYCRLVSVRQHDEQSGDVTVTALSGPSDRLDLLMAKHFSDPKNRCVLSEPVDDCMCAVVVRGSYFRAKIRQSSSDTPSLTPLSCVILLVDCGQTISVQRDRLLCLPSYLAALDSCAVPLRVAGIVPADGDVEWSPEATAVARSLLDGATAQAKIVGSLYGELWVSLLVKLNRRVSDGQLLQWQQGSLESQLMEAGLAEGKDGQKHVLHTLMEQAGMGVHASCLNTERRRLYVQEVNPVETPLFMTSTVLVTSVISPGELYVQRNDVYPQYERLMDELNEWACVRQKRRMDDDSGVIKYLHKVGQHVVALFQDQRWYRAVITAVNRHQSEDIVSYDVFFTDVGDSEQSIAECNVLPLTTKFATKLPLQAVRCSLAFCSPVDPSLGWSQQSGDALHALTIDSQQMWLLFTCQVVDRDELGVRQIVLSTIQPTSDSTLECDTALQRSLLDQLGRDGHVQLHREALEEFLREHNAAVECSPDSHVTRSGSSSDSDRPDGVVRGQELDSDDSRPESQDTRAVSLPKTVSCGSELDVRDIDGFEFVGFRFPDRPSQSRRRGCGSSIEEISDTAGFEPGPAGTAVCREQSAVSSLPDRDSPVLLEPVVSDDWSSTVSLPATCSAQSSVESFPPQSGVSVQAAPRNSKPTQKCVRTPHVVWYQDQRSVVLRLTDIMADQGTPSSPTPQPLVQISSTQIIFRMDTAECVYSLEADLAHEIDVESSTHNMTGRSYTIRLAKKNKLSWRRVVNSATRPHWLHCDVEHIDEDSSDSDPINPGLLVSSGAPVSLLPYQEAARRDPCVDQFPVAASRVVIGASDDSDQDSSESDLDCPHE